MQNKLVIFAKNLFPKLPNPKKYLPEQTRFADVVLSLFLHFPFRKLIYLSLNQVYAGVAYDVGEEPGSPTRVAVKLLRENSNQQKEFLMEANVMRYERMSKFFLYDF